MYLYLFSNVSFNGGWQELRRAGRLNHLNQAARLENRVNINGVVVVAGKAASIAALGVTKQTGDISAKMKNSAAWRGRGRREKYQHLMNSAQTNGGVAWRGRKQNNLNICKQQNVSSI